MSQTLLIIEDGSEYLRFFSRYLPEYDYLQAHSLQECEVLLDQATIAGIVLDLRFDRVPRENLTGDADLMADGMFGGDVESAWRYIIDNQGFLILRELRQAGHEQPALLVTELPERRKQNLRKLYGTIHAVPSFDRGAIDQALKKLLP